jgi:hypothetical protein
MGNSDGDDRSYRVNFDKIHSHLAGFRCHHSARTGAHELRELFGKIGLSDEVFRFRAYTRLKQLEHLVQSGQVDQDLYWRFPKNESAGRNAGKGQGGLAVKRIPGRA